MAYISGMGVEWDPEKERANLDKHGVSFGEAATLFSSDGDYLEVYDEEHSQDEDRFIAVGPVAGRIVVVVYTTSAEDMIRLISARPATRREIKLFREYGGDPDGRA